MTEEMLIEELTSRGHTIVPQDVIKNGVSLRGLSIRDDPDSRISPCIYIDEILKDFEDVSDAADMIERIAASRNAENLGINVEDLTNPDFIRQNCFIGVQKASEQNICKRLSVYDGIEQFLYIRGGSKDRGGFWSVKLNPQITSGIDVNELWKLAEEHTYAEFMITSMTEVLENLIGDNTPAIPDEMPMLYVVSNPSNFNGAACACDIERIKAWAEERKIKRVAVMPSSTHEMIILPVTDEDVDLDELSNLVREVNETQVQPTERLTDRAYLLNVA